MAPTLTRRQTLVSALALLAAAALPRLAFAEAAPATPDVPDMTMGDPAAPVTLVEYAMFSCPHCADFNATVFPKIKAEYIDTGKVKLVFREVYFNKQALWAAMIARCAPAERYFGIADLIFATQGDWLMAPDEKTLMEKLYRIGRQAGLTDAEMDKCMNDRPFAEAMVASYQKHATADNVEATPTFFLNGTKVEDWSWDAFKADIDKALGA